MKNKLGSLKKSIGLISAISFIAAIIVPLHPLLIDMSIVFTLSLSILIFMSALNIVKWSELKTFPTILLLFMIFRIALSIATTKKIISQGDPGMVVKTAGNYIIGGNVIVGLVIFIVLIVFQFIVANGSSRASEVAARFTLDSLPGKQMSIDSDLQQGLIDQDVAKAKRKELDMEIDYYGNMDAAGKFIKGDVILGIVLTVVNITVGLITGIAIQGLPLQEAAYQYTVLTVGDGVVGQIGSLLIAMASGMVVSRVYDGDDKEDLMQGIFKELTNNPMIMNTVAGVMLFIGILPGFPFVPFFVISAIFIYLSFNTNKKGKERMETEQKNQQVQRLEDIKKQKEKVEVNVEVEPITLVLGYQLIPLAQTESGGETLKDKIIMMRKNIASELGVKIPSIRVIDDSSLMPYTKYQIKVKENLTAEGELKVNQLLALKTPYVIDEIEGTPTKDPIFGEESVWIADGSANKARDAGYQVLDPLGILATHINEVVRRSLHELLTRQQVQDLLNMVAEKNEVLIKEINEEKISLSIIQKVLQNLLRENISVSDLPNIMEAIIDGHQISKQVDDITSIVREKIKRYICSRARNVDGKIYAIMVHPLFENNTDVYGRHDGYRLRISPEEVEVFIASMIREVQKAQMADVEPILLVQRNDVRFAMSRLLQNFNIPVSVMTQNELTQDVVVERVGVVMGDQLNEQVM